MHTETDVFNSRRTRNANQVWRRRRCRECESEFTTYERVDMNFIRIDHKPYKRAKLYQSLFDAFTIKSDQMRYVDDCVENIEARLIRLPAQQISLSELIDIVLAVLKPVSRSAYLRYGAAHKPEAIT